MSPSFSNWGDRLFWIEFLVLIFHFQIAYAALMPTFKILNQLYILKDRFDFLCFQEEQNITDSNIFHKFVVAF